MPVKVTGPQNLMLLFSRILLLLGLIALLASAYFPGFTMHQEMRSQTREQRYAEADYELHPWGYKMAQTTTVNQTIGQMENNATDLVSFKSYTSMEYKDSALVWMTYLLTGLLVFSVFTAIVMVVMTIRYDPKRTSRTKTTLALFYPLVFMVVAIALLFFFIVPQYFATEVGSADAFKPHMPTPAIGAGGGPYPEAGRGSEFDVLFPPDETDSFDFKVSWAPGMAMYLYLGSAILFMASFFFLRAHDKVTVRGAKGAPAAPENDDAEAVTVVDEAFEQEPVGATTLETDEEEDAGRVVAVVVADESKPVATQAKALRQDIYTAPKTQTSAVISKQAVTQVQIAAPEVVKADDIPSKEVTLMPAPSQSAPKVTASPDTGAPDQTWLDLNAGPSSGFDLRMEDEAPAPAPITIIEIGEADFSKDPDLEIEGVEWLTLQCPECGNTFKVSSRDITVKCERCGLESEIG